MAKNERLEIMTLTQITKLLMSIFIGGTAITIFVVAPALFKNLSIPAAAGHIVGDIFKYEAYLGLVATTLAIIALYQENKFQSFYLRTMWYCIVIEAILIINFFALFPFIEQAHDKLTHMTEYVVKTNFAFLHSVSAVLITLITILGFLYILEKK